MFLLLRSCSPVQSSEVLYVRTAVFQSARAVDERQALCNIPFLLSGVLPDTVPRQVRSFHAPSPGPPVSEAPLIMSHPSIGPMMLPSCSLMVRTFSPSLGSLTVRVPPIISLCPPRYLDAVCITKSAPISRGF